MEKTKTEILKESILTRINREVRISQILDEEADQEFIDRLTDEFIKLLEEELKKYQ